MKKVIVRFPESESSVETEYGALLLDAVKQGEFRVAAECGGGGRCGKCRVIVSGDVSEPSDNEIKHLSKDEVNNGIRLACSVRIQGDVEVKFTGPVVSDKISGFPTDYEKLEEKLDPTIIRTAVNLSQPDTGDQRSDLRRVLDSIPGAVSEIPVTSLRKLPGILRKDSFRVDIFSEKDSILDVYNQGRRMLGVALDIGTTTVCARLAEMESGEILASVMKFNPQRLYGADVASRITHSISEIGGRKILQKLIIECINQVVTELVSRAGVSAGDVMKYSVVGNTTMIHMFLGVDTGAIAVSPYISPSSGEIRLKAGALGIMSSRGAVVNILPSVAAYVGADAVSAAMRVRINKSKTPAAVIDLGTNAEIIMTDGKNVFACSAAAGPALEGAHIKHGMTAAPGAVCRVEIGESINVETIGGGDPEGLCGTGLLDSVAELVKMGLVEKNGRIVESSRGGTAGDKELICEGDDGREVLINDPLKGDAGRRIVLTQKDIRQFQLAKGAIMSGLELLLERAGLKHSDLNTLYLAGALGTSIRPESALVTGLVPDVPENILVSVGNAALDGATEALLSKIFKEEASGLARKIKYIELSGIKEFSDRFVEKLGF